MIGWLPGGFDWCLFVDVTLNLGHVHVRRVAEVFWESVVLCDDGIEDILEHLVRVLVSSIDAAVLVIELDGAGDGLNKTDKNKETCRHSLFYVIWKPLVQGIQNH